MWRVILQCLLFCVLWFWAGILAAKYFQQNKVVIQQQPATDEQLVQFWFGNGDKSALRERICNVR